MTRIETRGRYRGGQKAAIRHFDSQSADFEGGLRAVERQPDGIQEIAAEQYPRLVGTGDDFDRFFRLIVKANQHQKSWKVIRNSAQATNQHGAYLGQTQTLGQRLRQDGAIGGGIDLGRYV
jgi:hypothetical protein